MAYSVNIADSAKQEFRDALNYIALHYASPQAMSNLTAAYEAALFSVQALPNGYGVNEEACKATGHEIRRIRVKNYGLFYEVNEREKQVQIISFLHAHQDISWRVARDYELLN